MAKKLKLQESRVVISSERGLAAHRRLRFFERSVVPIVDRRANGGRRMEWARILAYITGTVDQELLLRNEYLAAENRIEGPIEGAAEAFGRGASEAWRDWPSTGPQGTRRSGECGPAGYHSGLVSKARRAQVQWLEASKPRPVAGRQDN